MTSWTISADIVSRAVGGDTAALAQAFESLRPSLRHAVASRIDPRVRARIDPSDVVQETYLDVERRMSDFIASADRLPLHLWFRLLALQRLTDLHRYHLGAEMRSAGREISLDRAGGPQTSSCWLAEKLIDRQETGSEVCQRAEAQQMVHTALETMDSIDRDVLAMRHFEMLSNVEVAQVLGISTTAASNRYIRALRRLEQVLAASLPRNDSATTPASPPDVH